MYSELYFGVTGEMEGSGMTAKELDTLGKRLRYLRLTMGLSQTDVRNRMAAEQGVEIGANYLSILESDRKHKRPSLEVMAALARVLGTTTDYLGLNTDDPALPQDTDTEATYITPEAERLAALADRLPASRRLELVTLAELMVGNYNRPATAEGEDALAMLQSIERMLGLEARRAVEDVLRRRYRNHDAGRQYDSE